MANRIIPQICLLMIVCSATICTADDRKTTADIIKSRGFNYDEFDIISQGYILKAFRIINPLADPKTLNKIPVVCHHGISFDSSNMMSGSALARPRKPKLDERLTLYKTENGTDDRGLYFYLSNNNYEVWVIQARGVNDRVMRRTSNSKVSKSFWDFSIDEQALFDLPTQIEFILKKTNAPKVAYISYSQSTTLMFALLSMRPEFSEKLVTFIAMAPVVFTGHIKGLTWPVAVTRIYLNPTSAQTSVPNVFRKIINYTSTYLCSISFFRETFCRKVWEAFAGPSKNTKIEGGLYEDALKETSLKSFEQYAQNSLTQDFRMYDYKDDKRNMEEYGQVVPPYYNVSRINLKTIVLFRGTNDYLSNPQDQMILISRLRVPLYEDHIMEDYSHIDFLTSPTIVKDVNEPVLKILDRVTGKQRRDVHTIGMSAGNGTQVQEEGEKGGKIELDLKAKASASSQESSGSLDLSMKRKDKV